MQSINQIRKWLLTCIEVAYTDVIKLFVYIILTNFWVNSVRIVKKYLEWWNKYMNEVYARFVNQSIRSPSMIVFQLAISINFSSLFSRYFYLYYLFFLFSLSLASIYKILSFLSFCLCSKSACSFFKAYFYLTKIDILFCSSLSALAWDCSIRLIFS